MTNQIKRRHFIQMGSFATASLAIHTSKTASASDPLQRPVRIGMIGVGGRGYHLLSVLLGMENITVPAVCDIRPERNQIASRLITERDIPPRKPTAGMNMSLKN